MADYVWTNASVSYLWSDPANWDLNDGSYPGEEAGDTATFASPGVDNCGLDAAAGDAASGKLASVTVAADYSGWLDLLGREIQCSAFAGLGGHINLNGGMLDVDGICNLGGIIVLDTATGGNIECAGNLTITSSSALPDGLMVTLNGTGTVSANISGNQADLVINTEGTHTASSIGYWDSLTMTAGTFGLATYAITPGNIGGTGGTLDVGTASITLTGKIFDGDSITVTGEAIGGGHCVIHGGTVQNVSMPLDDDALDCTDEVTDGGSNTNVWFSGCNGGHQIIGGGIIGSAEAA